MRLLRILFIMGCLLMCSCRGQQQPQEDSKEAFLTIMEANYQAVYDGKWDRVAQLRHPRELQEMQSLSRFNGEQWPPQKQVTGNGVKNISEIFPDPVNTRLEIAGNWARLVYEGPECNSLSLFNRVGGKWVWVVSVKDHGKHKFDAEGNSLDNPQFGISRLHVWPMQEDRLWLPPVELIVKKGGEGVDGRPRIEFHVKNVGVKPLTQWQLRAFFSSVWYRVDAFNAGGSAGISSSICRTFPAVLSPGEQLMLTDDIELSSGRPVTPGTYMVRWYASGYMSNEVEVEVE